MPRVREAQQIEGAKRHGAIVPPVANETFWGLGASTSGVDDKFDEIGRCVRLAALGQVNNHNVHVALCCQFMADTSAAAASSRSVVAGPSGPVH